MKKSAFTLIEVVVALGILAVGLGGMLQLAISAQLRMGNAMEKWQEVHAVTQAAEYLMLMDEETTEIPEEFFNYEGYTVNAYTDDADELPHDGNHPFLAERHPENRLLHALAQGGQLHGAGLH